jgi:single-strand DNA-binding protein
MSNLNLNKVILCGRLTADVELKQTPSGVHVCSFSLAVNRRFAKEGEQQADFITVVAWRQTAEFISKYFKKGSSLCVSGSIQTRSWKDNSGNNRHATEVVADEAMFVDSKSDVGNYDAPAFSSQPTVAPKFEDMKSDDDLPF